MYQAQVILYVWGDTEHRCQDRLDELIDFMKSVESEGFMPGLCNIDVVKPDELVGNQQRR